MNMENMVTATSYLTLNYRLAFKEGEDIVSTFNETPATLQLGGGQLAPFLEACLLDLPTGAHRVFELEPEQAFGLRQENLIQHVSKETLRRNSELGEVYNVGDLVEFNAPSGGRFAGVLLSLDEAGAMFDFNHPLAGKIMVFEVEIIGIL